MRHAGMHWPNGREDYEGIMALPSPLLLMLATEARWHYDKVRQAGKTVMWRGLPRVGKRPAEIGYGKLKKNAEEATNLWDEQPHYGTEYFVPYNELDLNFERGDDENDFDGIPERFRTLTDFLHGILPHLRERLTVGTKVFFPPWTPDHRDVENVSIWKGAAAQYDGLVVHAYGGPEKIINRLTWYVEQFPDKPIFLGEWNSDDPANVLEELKAFADRTPTFMGATYFAWHWYDAPDWWPMGYNVDENTALYSLFANQKGKEVKPYSTQDVLEIVKNAADTNGISRRLLTALLIAESGFKWNSARYAFRNADGSYTNLTADAEDAISRGDFATLSAILDRITNAGSTDISFGVGQQTVRWADDGDHTHSVKNVLFIRDRYFDVPYAVSVAAKKLATYAKSFGDGIEALCRYNKPTLPSEQNPNRPKYEKGLAEADKLLLPQSNMEGTTGMIQKEVRATSHSTTPFSSEPKGFILHGSRSGNSSLTKEQEYQGCANWCLNNPDDLSWNATIGENKYAQHMSAGVWGWNARAASDNYIAVEFAQTTKNEPITDAQVDAFVAFVKDSVLLIWPNIPYVLVTHAEVENTGETGKRDGKDDVFPFGDPRAAELKKRILDKLPKRSAPPESQYAFQFGFAAKAAELGEDVVGEPLENEYYIGDHHSMQMTTTGVMLYSKEANNVLFLPGR